MGKLTEGKTTTLSRGWFLTVQRQELSLPDSQARANLERRKMLSQKQPWEPPHCIMEKTMAQVGSITLQVIAQVEARRRPEPARGTAWRITQTQVQALLLPCFQPAHPGPRIDGKNADLLSSSWHPVAGTQQAGETCPLPSSHLSGAPAPCSRCRFSTTVLISETLPVSCLVRAGRPTSSFTTMTLMKCQPVILKMSRYCDLTESAVAI